MINLIIHDDDPPLSKKKSAYAPDHDRISKRTMECKPIVRRRTIDWTEIGRPIYFMIGNKLKNLNLKEEEKEDYDDDDSYKYPKKYMTRHQ